VSSPIRHALLALALLAAVARVASPQNLVSAATQKNPSPPAASPVMVADPLGRQTPAGTVMGFLGAAVRGDYGRASRYLDTKLPAERAAELAQELKVLLDRGLTVDLGQLSRKPEGEQDGRVGKDRELVGTIESDSGRLKVSLVRVRYGDQPPIWLFAPETLHDVPNFQGDFEPSFVEQYLPAWLVH